MLSQLKDYSIVYSFDRTGYLRHAERFEPIDPQCFNGKHFLITGGTSGIGAALADQLDNAGARVTVTGRNRAKFDNSALAGRNIRCIEMDMSDFQSVRTAPLTESPEQPFDGVICNAGGMPEQLHTVQEQYDQIFASQVIGHYLLIRRCIEQQLIRHQGLFHITSSGGMYLQKLMLDDLCWQKKPYDKVKSYANAKRAQVILNQELARQYPDYCFSCSHPGWVGTDAVKEALPGFYRTLKDRLRNNQEGADTIYWCLSRGYALPSGKFWFDRAARPEYPFFWTREKPAARQQLLRLCLQAWDTGSAEPAL